MNLFDCGNKLSVQQLDNFEKKDKAEITGRLQEFYDRT